MLWSAVLISVYLAVYLFLFGGSTVGAASAQPGGYTPTWVILTPVLMFSGLVRGARERFHIRTKPSPLHWGLYALVLAGFVTLGALSMAGVGYPWWLNAILPLVLLASMAATPIRGLLTTTPESSPPWASVPLAAGVRIMTTLIGLANGVLLATFTHPLLAAFSGLTVMVLLFVVLLGWRSAWGLPRVGYEWGPIHWGAFAICTATQFTCVVFAAVTTWFTTPNSIAAGVLVLVVMGISAVLPRENRRQRA